MGNVPGWVFISMAIFMIWTGLKIEVLQSEIEQIKAALHSAEAGRQSQAPNVR